MKKTFVLDANAALDFLEGGPGLPRVKKLFTDALDQKNSVLMSVVNLGEVFYHVYQEHGEERARNAVSELLMLSVQALDVDLTQAIRAGEIKTLHKIPYVDCLAAALALIRRATLVTGDRDFEKLGQNADILWIRRE